MENEKEFTAVPRRPAPNPLHEMTQLMKEQVAALAELQATALATQWAVMTLIDTHPQPEKAAALYLEHMDAVADSNMRRPERLAQAMQLFRDRFAAVAARHASKG